MLVYKTNGRFDNDAHEHNELASLVSNHKTKKLFV